MMDLSRHYEGEPVGDARLPQVPHALDQLDKACAVLGERLSDLRNRLEPVLGTNPEDGDAVAATRVQVVPLAERIGGSADVVQLLADQVGRMLHQLEL